MTLYELLHQVSFDEIVPFIERYHGWNALALYKIHYDYLRHLTPELGERTTAVSMTRVGRNHTWTHIL